MGAQPVQPAMNPVASGSRTSANGAALAAGYRTAWVTGASRGIGAAIVRALAPLGLEVHAVARSADALAALAAETGCIPHACDLTDAAAREALLGGAEIDVLVNNLGAVTTVAPTQAMAADALDAMLDVNLRTALHAIRLVLPGMVARNRGHIVTITSTAAVHTQPGLPLYGAIKAALHALAPGLRLELAGRDIRVTEILPGRVETDILVAAMGGDREEARRRLHEGRSSLKPEDVASAVAYAVSAPPHVNLSHIEITATRQVYGGMMFPPDDP